MANRQVVNATIAAYANAAIQGAMAAGGRDTVVELRNQMIEILGFMGGNIDLRLACDDEGYTPEQRESIVTNVFEGFNPTMIDLLRVMATRREVELLNRVYMAYEELIEEELNFSVIDVTTVVELDDHLRTVIKEKAEADLGRDCVLVEHLDPKIQGGIIMSTRGRYVDASVRSQFDQARIALKESVDGGEC